MQGLAFQLVLRMVPAHNFDPENLPYATVALLVPKVVRTTLTRNPTPVITGTASDGNDLWSRRVSRVEVSPA